MALRIVQLKNTVAAPGFISTKVLGEVVREKAGFLELKNACMVFEIPIQDRLGNLSLDIKYYTTSAVSNGVYKIKDEDIGPSREVEEGDEMLKGYRESLERFRLSKSNIQKADNISRLNGPEGRA